MLKNITARVSLSINGDHYGGTKLKIEDAASSLQFLEIKITDKQLALILSRMCSVECEAKVNLLDKIGKKMEHKPFEFEMPKKSQWRDKKIAKVLAVKNVPDGWEPDMYFGSQDSFFKKDDKEYARTTIRRWV